MATGDNLTAAKAIAAALLGFVAPGAAYLIGVADNGITANEWLVAAFFCLTGGAASGAVVYSVENKSKDRPASAVENDYDGV